MPDEGEKGNSVELGTFKNWGHNLIGYKTIQNKEKTYVNFVWCKVCAKHKNALKSNPACQGQAKIALQKYIPKNLEGKILPRKIHVKKNFRHLWGHSKSLYALREREGVRAKVCIYCFYDVILLFKSVQGGKGSENHQIWVYILFEWLLYSIKTFLKITLFQKFRRESWKIFVTMQYFRHFSPIKLFLQGKQFEISSDLKA